MVYSVNSRLLGQRYKLAKAIGRGGMGTVWLGHDELLDRPVAVKEVRVPEGLSSSERQDLLERQMREARICARLKHPSIVTVHDVILEDDHPWVVMELIEGRGLNSVVSEDGPLPLEQVADIGVQALDALRHAHAAGVLHRDIKPSNIMITEDGLAVLTDFGIATLEGESRLTQTGGLIGTPGYLAPEQVQDRYVGPESDLWALGATLYYIAEGRPAYKKSTTAATALAPVTSDPDPPERSQPLWPVIAGMMRRDPEQRTALAEAHAQLAEFDPSAAQPMPPQPDDYGFTPAAAPPAPPQGAPAATYPAQHGPPPSPPPPWPSMPSPHAARPAPTRRGTRIALLGVGAVAALLALAGVVAIAVFVSRPAQEAETSAVEGPSAAGEQEQDGVASSAEPAPDCAAAESEVMLELAPDAQLMEDTDELHDTWSQRYCEWRTNSSANVDDTYYVSVLFMRSEESSDRTAADDLAAEAEEYSGEPLDGVGEEAFSWYDDLNSVGCVGTRTADVYLRACYDAIGDTATNESIPADEAIEGATRLAVDTVAQLEE